MTASVAVIGGGVSASTLVGLLPGALALDQLEIRLAAQDQDRLAVIAGHGRALVADRPEWTVTTWPTAAEAAAGADVVVLMLRVGGLDARHADEELARSFGLPGDEGLGPAGAVNALRTLPVLAELADELRSVAPGATVLNLVAPLGITTRVLLDHGIEAIGVCELPAVTEAALVSAVGSSTELAYAGLNHLGWFWADASEPDGLVDRSRLVAAGSVDPAVLAAFGAVPLKYYYWLFDPPAAERLGIARDPGRTAHLIELRDRALGEMADAPGADSTALAARPTPWFDDGLVPMLAAFLQASPWRGFANVRNDGLVAELAADVVVESRATIVGDELHPEPLRHPMPPAVRSFLERAALAEDLIYRSWRDADDGLLVDAFVDGPHHVERSGARRLAAAIRTGARQPVGARR